MSLPPLPQSESGLLQATATSHTLPDAGPVLVDFGSMGLMGLLGDAKAFAVVLVKALRAVARSVALRPPRPSSLYNSSSPSSPSFHYLSGTEGQLIPLGNLQGCCCFVRGLEAPGGRLP